jgi:hypothetical protein
VKDKDKNQNRNEEKGVPRVELMHSPPVDWDLGAEGTREPKSPTKESGDEKKEEGSGTITKKQKDEFKSEESKADTTSKAWIEESDEWGNAEEE